MAKKEGAPEGASKFDGFFRERKNLIFDSVEEANKSKYFRNIKTRLKDGKPVFKDDLSIGDISSSSTYRCMGSACDASANVGVNWRDGWEKFSPPAVNGLKGKPVVGVNSWTLVDFVRQHNNGVAMDTFSDDTLSDLPVGTLLSYGDARGKYISAEYSKPMARHTMSVVGYLKDGTPLVFDWEHGVHEVGMYDKSYGGGHKLVNITLPKKEQQQNFSTFNKDLIDRKNNGIEPLNVDIDAYVSKIKKINPKVSDRFASDLHEFNNSILENRDNIKKTTGLSDKGFNELHKQALALAVQESATAGTGAKAVDWLFGSSLGLTQLQKSNRDVLDEKYGDATLAFTHTAHKDHSGKVKYREKIDDSFANNDANAVYTMLLLADNAKRGRATLNKGKDPGVIQEKNRDLGKYEKKFMNKLDNTKFPGTDFSMMDAFFPIQKAFNTRYYPTKGNNMDMSESEVMSYMWNNPARLRTGDAQGKSKKNDKGNKYIDNIELYRSLVDSEMLDDVPVVAGQEGFVAVKDNTSVTNALAPEMLHDPKINEERNKTYLKRLYSEYPAVKRFADENNVILHADADFTRGNTGAGSIEYFAPFKEGERNSVQYNTGFEYWNPNKEGASIVYHPGENDYQDIRGDYITHAMHEDKGYEERYDKFSKAFMDSRYGEDIKRDWFERVSKEENDGKAQHRRNNIDGVIRNLIFEGTNADFEKKRYWLAAKEQYFSDPNIKKSYESLINYLKTDDGKNIKGMQEGGKTEEVEGGILPEVTIEDVATPDGALRLKYRKAYPYKEYENNSLRTLHPERFSELSKIHRKDYERRVDTYANDNNLGTNLLSDELDRNPYIIDKIDVDLNVTELAKKKAGIKSNYRTDDFITVDINSSNPKFSRTGEYVGGNMILGGDFIEEGQTAMPKREWNRRNKYYTSKNRTDDLDKKNQLFQGITDGKYKIGNYDEFKDEDTIAPARFVRDFKTSRVEGNNSKLVFNNDDGDHNYMIGKGKVIVFDKETETYKYIYGSTDDLVRETTDFKKQYPNANYIQLDNGRYNYYIKNSSGLTREDYEKYYSGDIYRPDKLGFNIVVD